MPEVQKKDFYIQFIIERTRRGFLVRKHQGDILVKDDIIVNGIIFDFEDNEIHGASCSNPLIIKANSVQPLNDALKNNEIFQQIIKLFKGLNWNEGG
jgi:hypothetical protein